MKFSKISDDKYDYFYSLLEKDFCFEERKTKQDEYKAYKNHKTFHPSFIYKNNQIIGYICYWEFENFIFAEHFAILEELRNKSLGSEFLKYFVSTTNKIIIIEVEQPFDEMSKRRISFYKKNGAFFNDFEYFQPSYHNSTDKIPMYIASIPRPISYKEFSRIIKEIKDTVYKQS